MKKLDTWQAPTVTLAADSREAAEPVISNGSPDELREQLSDAGFYVQNGTLYEFDTLKLASEGKLITCFGNNAGSTYLILNLPPAPEQDGGQRHAAL